MQVIFEPASNQVDTMRVGVKKGIYGCHAGKRDGVGAVGILCAGARFLLCRWGSVMKIVFNP